ncbi:MAG: primosome assembly protein PriA [Actinomycetota bacterium]|nr:primosome assembly protein PriA [Actinomycetota bacterium]
MSARRPDASGQLALVPGPRVRAVKAPAVTPVPDPTAVVQVVVDSPLPHLDRVFDYAVTASTDGATAGSRVRVRFAGRLTDAYVVARLEVPEHAGALRPLERVLGPEPVLTPDTLALVQAVAERCAGTFSDVARAAVPPRHARAEASRVRAAEARLAVDPAWRERWTAYDAGVALAERIGRPDGSRSTGGVRAVWSAAPATSWAADVAALVGSVLARPEGGALVVVPDASDVARVIEAVPEALDAGLVAVLAADHGPERRYREFLKVLRGGARMVVGTRAAVFAPVPDLRLLVVWDDGDDALVDQQAPYWDARDVAALRSHLTGCDLVVGSPARSVVTQQWCRSGWAHSVEPSRSSVTARGPSVRALTAEDSARDPAAAAARIPHAAWQAARSALRTGPVLVQVARRGYLPAMSCQSCRELARCPCGGPLGLDEGSSIARCGWCGALAGDWACPSCGGRRLRAVAVGAERTAEEIGRAFPGVPVLASHGGRMIARIADEPAVVIATPGAEPACDPGYCAVLLLDARAQLQRPHLDAAEDAVRRWFAAARLARPGGRVFITAANALRPVQALVRWDAPWFADRELDERQSAGLPPAVRMAALLGSADDIADVAAAVTVPHRLLGPVPDPDRHDPERQRLLVSVARDLGVDLGRELRAIIAVRSAGRARPVHVRMDPRDL